MSRHLKEGVSMAGPKDEIHTTDGHEVEIIPAGPGQMSEAAYPCPSCGRETKEHHTPGSRICSHRTCREVIEPARAAKLYAGGPRLSPTMAALVPCPKCGKATKEHHTPPRSRICSNRACRFVLLPPA